MKHLLDNITWHSLTGAHAHAATGTDRARRYARGFSSIAGFASVEDPMLSDLEGHFDSGECFYCSDWLGPVPGGWRVEMETTMHRMVWESPDLPRWGHPGIVELGGRHNSQALALAELTHPGPFGPRTLELGDYLGVFDGDKLVAMAGERMRAAPFREISGVCTHPDYRGRGLARVLVAALVARQLARGETPFLHVVTENGSARRIYSGLGFVVYREVPLRYVARTG